MRGSAPRDAGTRYGFPFDGCALREDALDVRVTSQYEAYSEGLHQIIDFYVINTPVPKTSRRGRTFAEIGWKGAKVNTLQALLRKDSSLGGNWICDKQPELQRHLDRVALEGDVKEHAVYSKGGIKGKSDTKTNALFYGIRCALAHGAFRIFEDAGTRWYELENVCWGNLRGHFLLKESTLLSWRNTVLAGPDSRNDKRPRKKKCQR